MARTKEQKKPETVWKLVTARCNQLSDTVSAARVPFLLLLAWSFAWIWALYSTGFGYSKLYMERYQVLSSKMEQPTPDTLERCRRNILPPVPDGTFDAAATIKLCRRIVEARLDIAQKNYLDSTLISLPGGMGKLHVSDLGVMGNVGMLLLLTWTFLALRRENHAIKSFVDFAENRRQSIWTLRKFKLTPDEGLSAEHLAFAYQVVSQRFLFILSNYSRPLFFATAALLFFPLAASFLNLATDLASLIRYEGFEWSVYARFGVELVLFCILFFFELITLAIVTETSVLLQGWYLGVKGVWLEEWDETNADRASHVEIDLLGQSAAAVEG